MPKKMGENSKAVEAKARKDQVQKEKQAQKEKEEEDKLWEDDDKHVVKKMERKEDKEKKQQEALLRKKEREKLLEEEMGALKSAKVAPAKVTKAQIDAEADRREKILKQDKPKESDVVALDETAPISENVNRIVHEGHSARDVEEALSILSVQENPSDIDKHPEKRVRAAYSTFEEREMVRLKAEYPNFRLSQLKQMLKKEWQKSPDNPFNQPTRSFNTK
ncbi:putative Coiled-coil domain-containing protein 124 [Hypsibius exemplaris]|uniref:Coiled-coil domain-containing protein 124 n=1 Tax=Hypsibius exemplaris TaxID=2072580 RepID=A0A1W0X518_HYPEX|nr:putative Coiled-coil domain-containing protein 124 [Hypsibius exemplaris]